MNKCKGCEEKSKRIIKLETRIKQLRDIVFKLKRANRINN